ncbi:hypothetical protein J6590_062241 [Homalodisca vitripennis]|nr:hypothetical protein J6590_062241 [Homalodisca vitripennis]
MAYNQDAIVTSSQDGVMESSRNGNLSEPSPVKVTHVKVAKVFPTVRKEEEKPGVDDTAKEKVKVSKKQVFPWLCKFNALCREAAGSRSYKRLDDLMEVYTRHVAQDVKNCYKKPNRASKVKAKMNDYMKLFHMLYRDIRRGIIPMITGELLCSRAEEECGLLEYLLGERSTIKSLIRWDRLMLAMAAGVVDRVLLILFFFFPLGAAYCHALKPQGPFEHPGNTMRPTSLQLQQFNKPPKTTYQVLLGKFTTPVQATKDGIPLSCYCRAIKEQVLSSLLLLITPSTERIPLKDANSVNPLMTRNPTNGYIVDSGKGGNGLIAIPNQFGFDCARILTVRENVNRLAPISQTKILMSTFHNGCDHRLKDCRIRTHRNHQLPTSSHSQNSSACAAFCVGAVCVPFELRWWKRDHVQNILLYQSANSAVPTAAARPESHLLKTVGTPPGHSSNDNVQGGEIKTTVQSRAWHTRKSPSKAGHPLDTRQTCYHRLGFRFWPPYDSSFRTLSRFTPRYLTSGFSSTGEPLNRKGPILSICRLLVKATTAALVGLTVRPTLSHQFPTMFRAALVSSVIVVLNLPLTRITISSAYPCAKTPLLFKEFSRSSTTRFHRRGERTPPCGQPLVAFALTLAPMRVVTTTLSVSKAPIQSHT